MRIVHLVHNFPPEFRGGTERYLSALAPAQRAAGHDVLVVTGSELTLEGRAADPVLTEDWQGVPVRRVRTTPEEPFGVTYRWPRLRDLVLAEVQRHAPDVVHLHHWFHLGDELLARLPDVPVVATLHDAYAACPRFFLVRPDGGFCGDDLPVPVARCVECLRPDDGHDDLAGRVERRRTGFQAELARVSLALTPSRYHAEVMAGTGLIGRERLRVLPLALEPGPVPPAHRPDADRLRLVTFGNLSCLKGVDLLLQALAGLASHEPVELHLFGPILEADRARLVALGDGLPVHWHGAYDRETLARHAADLDLAVFPSRAHETFSLVVEEALELGWPVVVSDRGALPERIGTRGVAVPVEDARSLTRLLEQVLRDPSLLPGWRAGERPAAWTLVEHERRLTELYEEARGVAR